MQSILLWKADLRFHLLCPDTDPVIFHKLPSLSATLSQKSVPSAVSVLLPSAAMLSVFLPALLYPAEVLPMILLMDRYVHTARVLLSHPAQRCHKGPR